MRTDFSLLWIAIQRSRWRRELKQSRFRDESQSGPTLSSGVILQSAQGLKALSHLRVLIMDKSFGVYYLPSWWRDSLLQSVGNVMPVNWNNGYSLDIVIHSTNQYGENVLFWKHFIVFLFKNDKRYIYQTSITNFIKKFHIRSEF